MFVVFTSRLVTFCVRKKTPKLRDIKTRFEEEEEDKDKDKRERHLEKKREHRADSRFVGVVALWFCSSSRVGNESLDDKKHHHIHRLISTFIKAIKEEAKR